ncbi:MAG: hypothetical protein GWP08_09130 [Nitrospiraceae bacterium]|nr:hypothetical protein [Nitrospiraceae bacterium]
MNVRNRPFATFLLAMALLVSALAPAALADEEESLVQVLESGEPVPVKCRACERLKVMGSVKAVDALGAILSDAELSHAARFALESMPYPEAGAALREALDETSGKTKVGIVNSLGERRERAAVPALIALAGDADTQVAAAAIGALGRIGTKRATAALRKRKSTASPALQLAVSDALLECADQWLTNGSRRRARAVYEDLQGANEPAHIRVAAFRGLAFAAGDKAMAVVAAGLTGGDREMELAALGLIVELKGEAVAKELEGLLPQLPPRMQTALLEAVTQRGDRTLAPTVAAMVRSEHPEVRIAALGAMATTGDASSAPLLAQVAAETEGAEREAARGALDRLRGAGVNERILASLDGADPVVSAELLRSLAERRVETAVPVLLTVAEAGEELSVRLAALASLATLADEETVSSLVRLLVEAKSDRERSAAEKALVSVCGRSPHKALCAGKVLAGLTAPTGASVAARCALLRVCGPIGGPRTLEALRAGAIDEDEQVRDAAIRALAGSPDFEAAPDLLALARDASTPTHRVLALRGYIRLAGETADIPAAERLKMYEAALAVAQRDAEKKQVLSGVAKMRTLDALKLAQRCLKNDSLRAEAETACFQVASSIVGLHRQEAKAALRTILEVSENKSLRDGAQGVLDVVHRSEENITTWQVSGPYHKEGLDYAALFDVPFPPEAPGSGDAAWQTVTGSVDPQKIWFVDLLEIFGGDQRVAYLRTTINSPRKQKALLELGSDDGVKVWLNGNLVHANNAIRGMTPEADKAQVVLEEGDNALLVKVTQAVAGWSFCARFRKPDGSRLEGLTVRAE